MRQKLRLIGNARIHGAVAILVSSGASKLADTRHFGRLAATAVAVLGVAAVFIYLGGWFNP